MRKILASAAVIATSAGLSANSAPTSSAQAQSIPQTTPQISNTTDQQYRFIRANGIPDHATGQFPNPNNPNAISAQAHEFRLPLNPQQRDRITSAQGYRFGVALNGIPFDPGTAETWQGDRRWRYEALSDAVDLGLDHNHAHVQPTGTYHYHGLPTGLLADQEAEMEERSPQLLGYAADGFPIYAAPKSEAARSSYRLKSGQRPSDSGRGGPGGAYDGRFTQDFEYIAGAGTLDECNGKVGITTEYPKGTYHYYITTEFPYIPRCFTGQPDSSFRKTMSRPRRGQPGRPRPPHPPHRHR